MKVGWLISEIQAVGRFSKTVDNIGFFPLISFISCLQFQIILHDHMTNVDLNLNMCYVTTTTKIRTFICNNKNVLIYIEVRHLKMEP